MFRGGARNDHGPTMRRLRQAAGLTQADLGRLVGVSAQTISNIEGGSEPKIHLAMAIARTLGVSVEDIFARIGRSHHGSPRLLGDQPA